MSMARRIAALERARQGGAAAEVVVIRGGLSDDDPMFAVTRGGELQWQRGVEESYGGFTARVVASATAAGAALVVFGGLPK